MNRKQQFGRWVHQQRKFHKMTQRDLAARLDVTPAYISKIENAKTETMPSGMLLGHMALLFNISKDSVYNAAGYYDAAKLDHFIEKNPEMAQTIRRMYEQQPDD